VEAMEAVAEEVVVEGVVGETARLEASREVFALV